MLNGAKHFLPVTLNGAKQSEASEFDCFCQHAKAPKFRPFGFISLRLRVTYKGRGASAQGDA
jgi:hypothetical protein